HDFLPDEAAFGEIDAAELVHVGFVRKRVAVNEILAASMNAERNPPRSPFFRAGYFEPRFPECGFRIGRGQNDSRPQFRMARIGKDKADFFRSISFARERDGKIWPRIAL